MGAVRKQISGDLNVKIFVIATGKDTTFVHPLTLTPEVHVSRRPLNHIFKPS